MEGRTPTLTILCSRRTRSLAHHLAKTPGLLRQYGNIIEEQERRRFIEKVDSSSHKANVHYIPHPPVKRVTHHTYLDSVQLQLQTVHSSPSLNDCCHADLHHLKTCVLFFYVFGNMVVHFKLILKRQSPGWNWQRCYILSLVVTFLQ